MGKLALAIHGGAGTILRSQMTPDLEREYRKGLEAGLTAGWAILSRGGSSLDAVEAAVVSLEDRGGHHAPLEDEIAKAWCEALDLGLDPLRHVDGRAIGNVTIAPGRVPAQWGACVIEQRLLRENDERLLGRVSLPRRSFAGGDLFNRSAQVQRARAISGCNRAAVGDIALDHAAAGECGA